MNKTINPRIPAAKQMIWADGKFTNPKPIAYAPTPKLIQIRQFLNAHSSAKLFYGYTREQWLDAINNEFTFRKERYDTMMGKCLGFILAHTETPGMRGLTKLFVTAGIFTEDHFVQARSAIYSSTTPSAKYNFKQYDSVTNIGEKAVEMPTAVVIPLESYNRNSIGNIAHISH